MSYVIYHKDTTLFLRVPTQHSGCYKDSYETVAAARAALTRELKKGRIDTKDDYMIAEKSYFHKKIEKWETVTNLISRKEFKQPVNTPGYMSPSSEAYWSM